MAVLRRQGRRLGPDPASANAATIGGVIASNAGGMRCRFERNAYHTVSSLTFVLPSGTIIALHPTCSTAHLGLTGTLHAIAAELAENVLVPVGTTCCGTAGDRGLLHPELVISATREEKAALDGQPADRYLSANRTCEMGMQQATGRPYESFVFLLEELTRPEPTRP